MSCRTMQPLAEVTAADLDHLHQKNEAQSPNSNYDGANARETLLLGRVVNSATSRIGGPASGVLAPVNPGLTMAAAVS